MESVVTERRAGSESRFSARLLLQTWKQFSRSVQPARKDPNVQTDRTVHRPEPFRDIGTCFAPLRRLSDSKAAAVANRKAGRTRLRRQLQAPGDSRCEFRGRDEWPFAAVPECDWSCGDSSSSLLRAG